MTTHSKKKSKKAVDPFFLAQRAQIALGTGADFHSRRIYIVGEIGPETTGRILSTLPIMDDSPGQITVVLASPGGSESDGYAIYDAIRLAKNPVQIHAYGACQSIAALILQAGDLRLLSPECRFMIHNGSVELPGATDTNTLVSLGKEIESNNYNYHSILAERAGITLDRVRHMCRNESYFDSAEAVKIGFADGVLLPDGTIVTRDEIEDGDPHDHD